jgi:hypothetical protein
MTSHIDPELRAEFYLYFAYGSNMLTRRFRQRTPSAVAVGIGFVESYRLTFGKVSTDGSGKCTIERSDDPENEVYGVLFRVDTADSPRLDSAEGLGHSYIKEELGVVTP